MGRAGGERGCQWDWEVACAAQTRTLNAGDPHTHQVGSDGDQVLLQEKFCGASVDADVQERSRVWRPRILRAFSTRRCRRARFRTAVKNAC